MTGLNIRVFKGWRQVKVQGDQGALCICEVPKGFEEVGGEIGDFPAHSFSIDIGTGVQ